MGKVSVIIPVYKVEKYLEKCLDTVLSQSYPDYDVILVDDGSPDNCGAICDTYAAKDSRFHVIHQENAGLSAARNVGIAWALKNSQSLYLTFVDSDDLIHEHYLARLVAAMEDGAEVAICEKIDFQEENRINPKVNAEAFSCTGREACVRLYSMDGTVFVSAWAKMYHKGSFEGIRFPVGKIHEDQAVVPILLYNAKSVSKVPAALYYYRVRGDGIMGSAFSPRRFDDVDALENCRIYFSKKQDAQIVALIDERITVLNSLYTLYARKAGVYREIPERYKMSRCRAILNLDKYMTYDYFTWYVSKIYPWLLKPHSYWRKIKQIVSNK